MHLRFSFCRLWLLETYFVLTADSFTSNYNVNYASIAPDSLMSSKTQCATLRGGIRRHQICSVTLLKYRQTAEVWCHLTGGFICLQVMYFSSLFPYVVLICFLVRALLLKGSVDGIRHMFTPKVIHVSSQRFSKYKFRAGMLLGENKATKDKVFGRAPTIFIIDQTLSIKCQKLTITFSQSPRWLFWPTNGPNVYYHI